MNNNKDKQRTKFNKKTLEKKEIKAYTNMKHAKH
jgi:hypothetical protein